MRAIWEPALAGARPEFIGLSEDEVWQAVTEGNGNAIEAEVTRLAVDFFLRFRAYINKMELHHLPPQIMHVRVRHPIERVAVLIMAEYVHLEMGAPPSASRH